MWGSCTLRSGRRSATSHICTSSFPWSRWIVFARTRNLRLLLWIELANILLAPTLSAIPLGGFIASSGVGLWGFLAPIRSTGVHRCRRRIEWFIAWLIVFLAPA